LPRRQQIQRRLCSTNVGLGADDGDIPLLPGEGGGDLRDVHGEEGFVVDASRSGNVEGGMGASQAGGVLGRRVNGDCEELGGADELVGGGQERGEGWLARRVGGGKGELLMRRVGDGSRDGHCLECVVVMCRGEWRRR